MCENARGELVLQVYSDLGITLLVMVLLHNFLSRSYAAVTRR